MELKLRNAVSEALHLNLRFLEQHRSDRHRDKIESGEGEEHLGNGGRIGSDLEIIVIAEKIHRKQ